MSKASAKRARIMTREDVSGLIGQRVEKLSGKPFKSGSKINTVSGVVDHPLKPGGGLAFMFHEDDSVVAAEICKPAEVQSD